MPSIRDIQDRKIRLGLLQKKILLLATGGLLVGLRPTINQLHYISKRLKREWTRANREAMRRAIVALYKNKMVHFRETKEGISTMTLLDNGKKRVLEYSIGEIKIKKPKIWDKRWHIVLFDIPHIIKKVRDIFRFHLKRMEFYEFQKSVFIHPYSCSDEIDFLIEVYGIRPYVRQMVASHIDNELHLKKHFDI